MIRRWRSESGQALVEMALVLPLLLLFLLGIITYGVYINATDAIQQATRVGVRTAAIGDTLGCPGDSAESQLAAGSPPTVYGAVDNQLTSDQWIAIGSGTSALPVISYAAIVGNQSNSQQNDVLMTLAYAYHPVFSFPGLLPSTIEITDTYQMMVQTAQPPNATTTTEPTGSPYHETTRWTNPSPPASNVTYLTQPGGCS